MVGGAVLAPRRRQIPPKTKVGGISDLSEQPLHSEDMGKYCNVRCCLPGWFDSPLSLYNLNDVLYSKGWSGGDSDKATFGGTRT